MFYDRQGKPIPVEEWALKLADRQYTRIGENYIGPYRVSTVWLGLNHNFFGSGPALIFETIIFPMETGVMHRYPTEAAALDGHDQAVAWIKERMAHAIDMPQQD